MGEIMSRPHSFTHAYVISNHTLLLGNLIPNFSLVGRLLAFIDKNNFQWVWVLRYHTHMWLIMLSQVLGDHRQTFLLDWYLINIFQPK